MQITNATTPTLVFLLVSSTDDKTAVTGVTPTVQLSKNGGAFVGATNSPSEIANGWYKVALTTTETNTDGALIIRATGTGADEWRDVHQVLTTNPANVVSIANNAITAAAIADGAIDAATFAAGAIDAAAIATDAIGSAELAASAVSEIQSGLMLAASYSAPPSAAAIAAAVWDYLASAATTVGSLGKRIADNLDAAVNSRLASAAYTAPDNSTISAIAAKTTNLPSDPADASDIAAAFAAVPGAVRTNLATELGRIDVAISTRLAGAGYTAPPSAADNATAVRSELTTELGRLDAAMTSRATPAQVNAEVVDALSVDTYAEPGSVPAATASLKDKIGWLFMLARNKRNTTGSADAVRNDADSATVATAALADDGTTFVRSKYS